MQNNFTLSFRQHNTKGRQPWPIDKVYDSLQREIWKRASDSDGLIWCKCGEKSLQSFGAQLKVRGCMQRNLWGWRTGIQGLEETIRFWLVKKWLQKNQKRESRSEINTRKSNAKFASRTETNTQRTCCCTADLAVERHCSADGGQSACAAVPLNVTMVTFHCDVRIFTFLTKCDNTHNIMCLCSHLT